VAYVLDRDCPFELRFARGVAFLISDFGAAHRAANRVPGNAYMPAPGPAATRRYEELLALIKRARIEVVPNRKGEPKGVRVSPGGPEALIDVRMAELVQERYPTMPGVYSLLSGVTHGMPHRLDDNARVADRLAQWNAGPSMSAALSSPS
jgi:hypothetical protein